MEKQNQVSINPSGYFISRFAYPLKYKLPVTDNVCYTSGTFDENLHQHISHELADDARPAGRDAKATRHSRYNPGCAFRLGLSSAPIGQEPGGSLDRLGVSRF